MRPRQRWLERAELRVDIDRYERFVDARRLAEYLFQLAVTPIAPPARLPAKAA